MKRERGCFRTNAKNAKTRLGNGFWQDVKSKRKASIETALQKGKTEEEVLNFYITQLKKQIITVNDSEDEEFYQRIKDIVTKDPSSNPLANILDRDYMQTLAGAERERYVFNTSKQVQNCLERLEQEEQANFLSIAK